MEDADSREREGQIQDPGVEHIVLLSSKPLHRFVQKEPRSLGIVLVLYGCAELLMGVNLLGEPLRNSNSFYVPFWLGAQFLLCGSLSIFTGASPSKKMVTVCLAMFIVCIFGIIVATGYRISCFIELSHKLFLDGPYRDEWAIMRLSQLFGIESILLTSSLGIFVLLIFLSSAARLSLTSSHTQVILQQVQAPPTQPSN